MKSQIHNQSRRNFLRNTIVTGSLLPLVHGNLFAMNDTPAQERLKVHIFSKHLQFLNWKDLAEAAADMGFDGVDLTVRPQGHVLPEKVETDLPKAVEEFRKVGLAPLMMTTAVGDAADATDKKLLETASKLGFKYYRMNWYSYPEGKSMPEGISLLGEKVKGLSLLNKELGLAGCYQNHAGTLVGSSLWEIWGLLKDADKDHMGTQYDIRHSVVEGFSSWPNSLRLMVPHIKTIALKDFKWTQKNGVYTVEDTPMGEGIVDFKQYFRLLKQYKINVPVSLHLEYDLGGAQHGDTKISADKKTIFKAMKKDLQKVQELWQQA